MLFASSLSRLVFPVMGMAAALSLSGCTIGLSEKLGSRELVSASQSEQEGRYAEAAQLYVAAGEQTDSDEIRGEALYKLASLKEKNRVGGDVAGGSSRIELLTQAASLGNVKAAYALANAYRYGHDVSQNAARAQQLYRQIEADYPQAKIAQAALAVEQKMVVAAKGDANSSEVLQQKIDEAISALETEARMNPRGEAPLTLARLYRGGDILTQNNAQAEAWYRTAIAAGNSSAASELAWMWLEDKKRKNYVGDALSLLEQAANKGDDSAARSLANLYLKGIEGGPNIIDKGKAFAWYKKSADQGSVKSMRSLGRMLLAERNVKGVQWLEKAAQTGSGDAWMDLGRFYRDGIRGVAKPNGAKSFAAFTKAKQFGIPRADFELARAYERGIGVARNRTHALRLYQQAYNNGVSATYKMLGEAYLSGHGVAKNPKRAAAIFTKDAREGRASAMLQLANLYAQGHGVGRNDAKAFHWYQQAARAGKAEAYLPLAEAYTSGRGVRRNSSQAAYWMRKLVAHSPDRLMSVANAYTDGRGVARNPTRAIALYEQAARGGNRKAMTKLAHFYEGNKGVARNEAKAFRWHKAAAERGHAKSMLQLAESYKNGEGTVASVSESLKWYQKAARAGMPDAYLPVAKAYATGDGVKQSIPESVVWYQKAAQKGSAEGQYQMGLAYARGFGVPKDMEKAKHWLALAKKNGYLVTDSLLQSLR